jgi:hypothetical protein
VLTTSHAYWSARAARRSGAAGWAALGGVLPDLPAVVLAGVALAQGRRGPDLLRHTYQRPGPDRVHRLAHSLAGPAALLLTAPGRRRRALALGWAGHLAADLVTHHDDAWPHLYPLSPRRWRSPVSYWQREWHGRAWSAAESAALAVALATERTAGRRAAALAALVAAALPLTRRHPWTAHGCVTPASRRRSGPGATALSRAA